MHLFLELFNSSGEEGWWSKANCCWLHPQMSGGYLCWKKHHEGLGELVRPYQLVYGIPQGAQAAVHTTIVYLYNLQPNHLILKLDFRNTFNCLLWEDAHSSERDGAWTIPTHPFSLYQPVLSFLWVVCHWVMKRGPTGLFCHILHGMLK